MDELKNGIDSLVDAATKEDKPNPAPTKPLGTAPKTPNPIVKTGYYTIGKNNYEIPDSEMTGNYNYKGGILNIGGHKIPMKKQEFENFKENPDYFKSFHTNEQELANYEKNYGLTRVPYKQKGFDKLESQMNEVSKSNPSLTGKQVYDKALSQVRTPTKDYFKEVINNYWTEDFSRDDIINGVMQDMSYGNLEELGVVANPQQYKELISQAYDEYISENPKLAYKEYNNMDPKTLFESWQSHAYARNQNDENISKGNAELQRLEEVLNFANDEEHQKWLDLSQGNDMNAFENLTYQIIDRQNKPTQVNDFLGNVTNEMKSVLNQNIPDLVESGNAEIKLEPFQNKYGSGNIIRFNAELGYNSMTKITNQLDAILKKYGIDSYFDMETTGRAVAYIYNQEAFDKNLENDITKDRDYNLLKELGYNDQDIEEILKLGEKSEQERAEREKNQIAIAQMRNAPKKYNSTEEEFNTVVNYLKQTFGITNDFNKAFYLLPDGTMLNGAGGGSWHRNIDHREINSGYLDNNIELDEKDIGGNSNYMEDFMSHGAIRLQPENNSLQIVGPLTDAQKNVILNLVSKQLLDEIEINNQLYEVKTYDQIKNLLS